MDAPAALDGLLDVSTQVVEAVIAGPDGVEASSTTNGARSDALAAAGAALLAAAAEVRPGALVDRVAVELADAAIVVVRAGERSIVVTTVAEPTVGLVTYDLRSALRRIAEEPPAASRRRKRA